MRRNRDGSQSTVPLFFSGGSFSLFSLVLLFGILLTAQSGCGPGACATGHDQVCVAQGNCRCGAICTEDRECTASDICVHTARDPSGPGVCADTMWATGMPPPCSPVCRGMNVCVGWSATMNSCAAACATANDCSSKCCVALREGERVCAPSVEYCERQGCGTPCKSDEVCVAFGSTPTCARRCSGDPDCAETCCLAIESSGSVCANNRALCPTPPSMPCQSLDACVQTRTQQVLEPETTCGVNSSYEGTVSNFCSQQAICRACFWSPASRAYTDCVTLGPIPPNATVPMDTARCAGQDVPNPPVRVRCTDVPGYQDGFDCLGSASAGM